VPVAAAGNDQGHQLAAMCASCHRLDGADKDIPAIVGVDAKKLAAALFAYRASEGPNHIMHAVALSLSDEQIASVARYLAEQGK
jgi:cytochrome c553